MSRSRLVRWEEEANVLVVGNGGEYIAFGRISGTHAASEKRRK